MRQESFIGLPLDAQSWFGLGDSSLSVAQWFAAEMGSAAAYLGQINRTILMTISADTRNVPVSAANTNMLVGADRYTIPLSS